MDVVGLELSAEGHVYTKWRILAMYGTLYLCSWGRQLSMLAEVLEDRSFLLERYSIVN